MLKRSLQWFSEDIHSSSRPAFIEKTIARLSEEQQAESDAIPSRRHTFGKMLANAE